MHQRTQGLTSVARLAGSLPKPRMSLPKPRSRPNSVVGSDGDKTPTSPTSTRTPLHTATPGSVSNASPSRGGLPNPRPQVLRHYGTATL